MLNGSMAGPDGGDIAIKDGMIDGANISFWLSIDMGGNALKLTYKGVVASDQIKISGDAAGMPFEFVVKKGGPRDRSVTAEVQSRLAVQ